MGSRLCTVARGAGTRMLMVTRMLLLLLLSGC